MRIIKQSFSFEDTVDGETILQKLERAGRNCYKSENNISRGSAEKFIRNIVKSGHESVIEHVNISTRIITDRGVSHKLARHRIASYSQESTRYCNYSKDKFGNEITVILPVWFHNCHDQAVTMRAFIMQDKTTRYKQYQKWRSACLNLESAYFDLLKMGQSPQEARSILPNSLKTEIITTMNLRSWRNFFRQRTSPQAHPQIKLLAVEMLSEFNRLIPVVFEDILSLV